MLPSDGLTPWHVSDRRMYRPQIERTWHHMHEWSIACMHGSNRSMQACVWQCTRELARAGKIKQCADVWLDLSISCLRLISCMHAARFPPMHDRACGIDLDKGRRSKTNHDTPAPPRNIYTYACIFRSKRYIHYWKIGMHSKCVHVSLNSRRYIWHNHAYNF